MRIEGAVEGAAASATTRPTFLEFFCGGGMARVGLGAGWRCLFANDIDSRKARAYAGNFGADPLAVKDVAAVEPQDIPVRADLAWASFPCQDLSLAGAGAGLDGQRSGAFWPFWRLMQRLRRENRAPRLIVLENVCGLLSSRGGADFAALIAAVQSGGYRCGALVIDAVAFTPQSRPRLFLLAVANDIPLPATLRGVIDDLPSPPPLRGRLGRGVAAARISAERAPSAATPLPNPPPQGGRESARFGVSPGLMTAYARLDPVAAQRFIWWRLPAAARRNLDLADLIEDDPKGVEWKSPADVERLLALMAPIHRERVARATADGGRHVGALYRRIRPLPGGGKTQRAEVRFDGLAGCLRTPAGGSSRQSILIIENGVVRARLLSAREAARLMGLPDTYALPAGYNEAYHLLGDGVVAPIVRHLATHWMEPILRS